MIKSEEILKVLAQFNLISQEQLTDIIQAAHASNKKITDVLLERRIIDAEGLTKIIAKILNYPYESLIDMDISEQALNTIPSEVAENYKIICFDRDEKNMKVGIVDSDNFKALEAVDFLAKGAQLQVEYYLISDQSFSVAVKRYKTIAKELTTALETKAQEEEQEELTVHKQKEESSQNIDEISKSAPITKIVSVIIRHAVEGGASDIHVEPLPKETRVRYRIDGVLHTSLILPRSIHNSLTSRIKVLANLKLDETRVPQDGRIRLRINEKDFDFRVSVLPLMEAEKVVMRILDTSKKAPTLDELGYQGIQLDVVKRNLSKTEGMLLATGPTGSGKSTTLFSLLNILNEEGVNISTLEDPVEYQIKGINQSQIKPDIGYTFASGLRSFLRQDPDVIMVGEIRDEETAELAIHAALTGHFVLSTLHTNSAPGAIDRLVDMKIEPFLLVNTLHTVIAQRLGRKICRYCKEKMSIPEDYLQTIRKKIEEIGVDYIRTIIEDFDPNNITFYRGKGCPRCGNTGYSGRVAIVEVLDVNDKIKELILSGNKHVGIQDIRASQRYISMEQDGIIKVISGLTTMEEVLRNIKE